VTVVLSCFSSIAAVRGNSCTPCAITCVQFDKINTPLSKRITVSSITCLRAENWHVVSVNSGSSINKLKRHECAVCVCHLTAYDSITGVCGIDSASSTRPPAILEINYFGIRRNLVT
jgi:hypothetical protein